MGTFAIKPAATLSMKPAARKKQKLGRKIEEIRINILDDLESFFPRVQVTSLELIPETDRNTIVFSMRYAIADSNISDEVVINFDK